MTTFRVGPKKKFLLLITLLACGAAQGCDALSEPIRTERATAAAPSPMPTAESRPSPSPESIPLPPEIEASTGQPVLAEQSNREKSAPAADSNPNGCHQVAPGQRHCPVQLDANGRRVDQDLIDRIDRESDPSLVETKRRKQ